jgi:hypothetical protein
MLTTYNLSFSKGKIHVDIFDAFTGVRIAGGIWSDADAMSALAFLKDHQDELTFMPRGIPETREDFEGHLTPMKGDDRDQACH